MSKNIKHDKFYTPKEIVNKCLDLFFSEVNDISEVIEPAAGDGRFVSALINRIGNDVSIFAYDIKPDNDNIIKQDFLELDLPYKKGRAIIGNPPFGDRNNMARSFYKKSCDIGDYIGFVLPISQMDNKDSLYDFDLIKSIDLGRNRCSGFDVHCCFNIYKRPESGLLNKKPILSSDIFDIYRDDQSGYDDVDYDLCIYRRGANAGKERLENINNQSYKIVVHDKNKLDYVKGRILNFDWGDYKVHHSSPSISKNDIYRLFINE